MLSLLILSASGCHSASILGVGQQSQTISARVGQEITVTLGNVGPGEFATPPLMSSTVLTYLGVEVVPPFTPAGPTQRFRFSATSPGQAIVEFRRSRGGEIVEVVTDTINVR